MNKKRIVWISIPAFISTDRFIVPEVSKYYYVDWILIVKEKEKVDFLKDILAMNEQGVIHLKIVELKERNYQISIIPQYIHLLHSIKNNYDLYYTIMIGMPYYMYLWKAIIGNTKTIVGIHNVHVPKGGSDYWFCKIYNHYTIRNFNYFHTFSKGQKDDLLKLAPRKKCEYAPFCLMNYGAPVDNKKKDIITFLNFGMIRDYKRIDVLINAAQRAFERTRVFFKVIIAGNCNDWDKYNQLITYKEIFDLRIYRIDDKDVPNLFAETDYFVAPYQDIAQSGSAIIAVNYNKPIIASKLQAFEDYVIEGKTGFLITPSSVEELAEKIVYILKNHNNIYHEMSLNIEKMKYDIFSPEKVATKYIEQFESVIGG